MNKNTIPIFYTVDENYVPFFAVSLASLIEHSSKAFDYTVHVVYKGLKLETIRTLRKMSTDNVHIIFNDMEKKIKPYKKKLEEKCKLTKWPITIYFRIFIASMFQEYDKGIYIDSDTVVLDDIAKLYYTNLLGNLIGAVADKTVKVHPLLDYVENYVGVSHKRYINSGMLLLDMKKLREVQFDSHFLYLLTKYNFEVVAPDQDYINAMAAGNILFISPRWNSLAKDKSQVKNKLFMRRPRIAHYNFASKPWHYDNILYEEYFWKYANKSVYAKEIHNVKNKFTDAMKAKDRKVFEDLAGSCARLSENQMSFKHIFDNKIETRVGEKNDRGW